MCACSQTQLTVVNSSNSQARHPTRQAKPGQKPRTKARAQGHKDQKPSCCIAPDSTLQQVRNSYVIGFDLGRTQKLEGAIVPRCIDNGWLNEPNSSPTHRPTGPCGPRQRNGQRVNCSRLNLGPMGGRSMNSSRLERPKQPRAQWAETLQGTMVPNTPAA